MADEHGGGGKRRLFAFLRVALGLAVLAFVARSLPWRDQLAWKDPAGAEQSALGTIEGDWKADEVRFRPAPEAVAPAELEPDARARWGSGEPLVLRRGESWGGLGAIDWKPGMPRAFASMESLWLVRAVGLFLLSFLVVVTRWWRLLALAGCPTSWFNALRLTFLGMFFNLVVPGLTGGDVIKAVIVARENPRRRADALVSVVVDRILGMGSLALIAAAVILVSGDAFRELRLPLFGLLAAGLVGVLLYASPHVRRGLGLSKLVDRLPLGDKLRSLDRAALVYLGHPLELSVAVLLSLFNHAVIIFGVQCLGHAVGVDAQAVGLRDYFVVVPVANIVSALPLAPGGWGLGEAAYGVLFKMIGASATLGVAISVVFRLIQLGFGLVGGLFLLLPGAKDAVRRAEAEAESQGA